MRCRKKLFIFAALLGVSMQLSVPRLQAFGAEEKPRPQRRYGFPAVILEYLEKNYGLTEDLLQLSRWIPQTRPELLSGPTRRSVLADVPIPIGYSSTAEGARLIFPQVADGSLGAGGKFYQTVFSLTGNPFNDAGGAIEFFQDDGTPMTVNLNGVGGNRFPVELKKGEIKRLTTSGGGVLKTGWARILTDQPIVGSVSFGVRDASGAIYADVGVDEAPAGKNFTLFADTRGDTDTGLALVNPSPTESLTLRLGIYQPNGTSLGFENVILPPLGHTAKFVSQLFSRVAGIAEFEGSINVTADKVFSGTTLRIIGDQMTTLPMVPPAAGNTDTQYLPQIANGSSSAAGIRYATTLVLFNTGAERAAGVVRFHASDGSALNLTLGATRGNEFPFDIAARGVLRLSSDASGTVQTGWAEVVPFNPGIQAAAVFHVQDLSGRLVTEVGVQGVESSRQFRLQADTLGSFDTGVAVANTDSSKGAGVQLVLYDSAGVRKAETCLSLGPQQHVAVFLTQLFRTLPGIGEFSGSLAVVGSRNLGVLSLRAVEEKLTSVPAVRTKLGFRPISVMSLLQPVSGGSPPVRWQIRANAYDLSMARATFSAPAMGLRLEKVSEKMPFAAGFIYGDNVAGFFQGQVLSMVDLLFAKKVTGNSVEFDFQQLHGKLSGSPTGNLTLELTPISPQDPGSTTFVTDLDIELYLPAGIVTTPAGMRSMDTITEIVSVPVSAEYAGDALTCKVRQNHPLTPVDPAKAQIVSLDPHFLFPGALLKISGTNLGSQPRTFFKMNDGSDVEAELLDLNAGVLSVQVPLSGIPTEMRVDSGTGAGLPVTVTMPFAPTFDLWSATRGGGTSTPFSFILRQEARQLATAEFEVTLYGVDCNLAALTLGTVVGNSALSGASVTQTRIGLWDLKVASAAAGNAVLQVAPPGSDKPAGQLTLEKIADKFTGIRITYSPIAQTGTNAIPLSLAAQYFAAERVFNFTGIQLQLPAAGKRVFGGAAITSIPFGEGKPSVNVQRSISFKTEAGTAQLQTTTTTAPPPSSTTTTFPCQAGSLPSTTSTTTISTTTLRPTTTSTTTSSTVRVTTSTTTSSTIRSTTTTSTSTSTSTTARVTTTTVAGTTTSTRPTTTTTLPAGGACNLFADDFNRDNYSGWTPVPGMPGLWQVLNGMLQVSGLAAGDEGLILRSGLPAPYYFELNVDLQSLSFSGPYQGFQPYSNTAQFRLSSGVVTDGIGAGVDASGNAGFLMYDLNAGEYLLLDKQSYGPAQSVGVQYSSTGITLLVNRLPKRIISAGLSAPPSIENVSLVATGPGILRFDNVCQGRLAPLTTKEAEAKAIPDSAIQLSFEPRTPGLLRRPQRGR